MRKFIIILSIFIVGGFCACSDECKTCPDGYGLVDDECKCVGFINGSNCYTLDNLLSPDEFKFQGDLYYSFDSNTSNNYQFNSNPQLISVSSFSETGVNSESATVSLIEDRDASNFSNIVLRTSVQREKGTDSAWFQPFFGEKGFGPGSTAFSTSEIIDGKKCYLRPYLVQLDSRLYRLHLKWETEDGEVIDICTKVFRR